MPKTYKKEELGRKKGYEFEWNVKNSKKVLTQQFQLASNSPGYSRVGSVR